MGRSRWLVLALGACATAGEGQHDAGVDAPCAMTFYRDGDGDGHGDPATATQACAMSAGMVTSNDDCDDTTASRRPGLAEFCDGLDNDCSAATADPCPASCTPARRAPPNDQLHVYLVCSTVASWADARSACTSAGHRLVQVENAGENSYVQVTANAAFGPTIRFWIGGTDSLTESTWVWDASDPFWMGATGGGPIGGRYTNWAPGEPNDSNTEDCTEVYPDGLWNDFSCAEGRPFICRH